MLQKMLHKLCFRKRFKNDASKNCNLAMPAPQLQLCLHSPATTLVRLQNYKCFKIASPIMLQKLLHKLCFKNCFTKYASNTASQSMLQKTACQQCLHHSSSCVFSHLQQHLLDCKTTNASVLLYLLCFKNCLTYYASKTASQIMLQKLLQK